MGITITGIEDELHLIPYAEQSGTLLFNEDAFESRVNTPNWGAY